MDREAAIDIIRASPLASDADRLIADLFPTNSLITAYLLTSTAIFGRT
jgi:hypothetical protein